MWRSRQDMWFFTISTSKSGWKQWICVSWRLCNCNFGGETKGYVCPSVDMGWYGMTIDDLNGLDDDTRGTHGPMVDFGSCDYSRFSLYIYIWVIKAGDEHLPQSFWISWMWWQWRERRLCLSQGEEVSQMWVVDLCQIPDPRKNHSFGHSIFDHPIVCKAPNLWPAPRLPKSVFTGEAAISELIPGVVLVGPRRGRVTRLVPHAPWWYDLRLFQWLPIFSPIRFLVVLAME